MNLRNAAIAASLAAVLAGCGTTKSDQTPSNYRFDYQTTESIDGVIRAFDDGFRTIVQFVDLEAVKPTFKDENGKTIPEIELEGQYAVLPRLYQSLTVTTGSGSSVVYTYAAATLPAPATTSQIQAMPQAQATPVAAPQAQATPVPVPQVQARPIAAPQAPITPKVAPQVRAVPIAAPQLQSAPSATPQVPVIPRTAPQLLANPQPLQAPATPKQVDLGDTDQWP